MNKMFFSKTDNEMCFLIGYWKDKMEDYDIDEMVLNLAERETGSDYFFCNEYFAVGEKGECGKVCAGYKPNNGKNGRCKHYGYCYDMTEVQFLLKKLNGKFKLTRLTTKPTEEIEP